MLATIHTGYGGLDRHAMKLQRFRGDSVYYTIYQQSGGGGEQRARQLMNATLIEGSSG